MIALLRVAGRARNVCIPRDDQTLNYVADNFTSGYVWLVITAQDLDLGDDKNVRPVAHPIHIHGHDFVILAQETNAFNETTEVPKFNFDNPPRRDVALLYAGGYLALAFKPDNPGVWLVHCHIAFHAARYVLS